MRFVFLVASMFGIGALSGCSMVSVPDEEPVFSEKYRGNYSSIADCSYSRLQRSLGQITLARLESRKAVELSEGEYRGVRWTLEVRDAGDGWAEATFRSVRAVWGRNFYADQVRPSLEACAR